MERVRAHDRHAFRAALLAIAPEARDAWLDRVLGLGLPPDDGPELPRGCVPYIPCRVDALLEAVELAQIGPDDVVVDVGSGVGRAMALVHLLTGASAIGIEIQAELVRAAIAMPHLTTVHGDAVERAGRMTDATVFFLYCPFSGERLEHLLDALEPLARARSIRVCCVDVTLLERDWLVAEPAASTSVTVYRSSSAAR